MLRRVLKTMLSRQKQRFHVNETHPTDAEREGLPAPTPDSVDETTLRSLLGDNPGDTEIQLRLGMLLGQRGDLDAAQEILEPLAHACPRADVLLAFGNVLLGRDRIGEAIEVYRLALALVPDSPSVLSNLGLAFLRSGRLIEARATLTRAVLTSPNDAGARVNLGTVYRASGEIDAAVEEFKRAMACNSSFDAARRALAETLISARRIDELAEFLETDLTTGQVTTRVLLAVAEYWRGNLLRSEKLLRSALVDNSRNSEAWDHLGVTLQARGQWEEALQCFSRSVELDPGNPVPRWHRSVVRLSRGDFAEAWPDYEMRLAIPAAVSRQFPLRRWRGPEDTGQRVLVYGEQGLGDEIMFASCIPDLVAAGYECVVDCHPKLGALFTRSFPGTTIHAAAPSTDVTWLNRLAPVDCAVPIGSLPLHYRSSIEAFPRNAYLKADPAKVARWRATLKAISKHKWVGISWIGGTEQSYRERRSIALERWWPLFAVPGIRFISLQYTACNDELRQVSETTGVEILHWQEVIEDLDETAALVCALDVVVSVQTALVHLCGALGCPVSVLVPSVPEWRYLTSGDTLPWYSSVRLFRQRPGHAWDSVLQEVAQDLDRGSALDRGLAPSAINAREQQPKQ